MSTHRGSLRLYRRSLLLYVAMLCLAVFGQHSAHAAKTASRPFDSRPCPRKVAAEAPSLQQRVNASVRRAARPARGAQRSTFWSATPLPSTAGLTADAAGREAYTVQARRDRAILPQRRPYNLRV